MGLGIYCILLQILITPQLSSPNHIEATQPACKKYNQNDEGNNYEKTDKNVFCVKLRPYTMYVEALLYYACLHFSPAITVAVLSSAVLSINRTTLITSLVWCCAKL